MEIQIVNENKITPEMDNEIKKALCLCFPADIYIFSKSRAWHGSNPAWSVIIKIDDCIAAHVGIVDRTVKAGTSQLRVAGMQNVFVRPEYRGMGLCEKVMSVAMNEADKKKFDTGLLYCVPQLEKVYARCGWQLLPNREIIRIDENGNAAPLPQKNIAMFFPLKVRVFPNGIINLQGNDW